MVFSYQSFFPSKTINFYKKIRLSAAGSRSL